MFLRLVFVVLQLAVPSLAPASPLRAEEIATGLGVVYATRVGDMNDDGNPDIVVITNKQVLWFENPNWTKHIILDRPDRRDNVSFALQDIDGDGKLDMALAGDWQPTNTTSGGSLEWLHRDFARPDGPWKAYPIGSEPTLHRLRFGDLDGDGKLELVAQPLHGRGNQSPAFTGAGVRLMVFRIPADPTRDPWPMEIADDSLHSTHNFTIEDQVVILAAREGLMAVRRSGTCWHRMKLAEGSPGEVKLGLVGKGKRKQRMFAAIEPWHGTKVVVYADPGGAWGEKAWVPTVIDETLVEGHGIAWADTDGDGQDELYAGWRKGEVGVARYDRRGSRWKKTVIDAGGMATEDLWAHDLDADGAVDLIAGGRATENVKIYWGKAATRER